jgi:hypothetical protein
MSLHAVCDVRSRCAMKVIAIWSWLLTLGMQPITALSSDGQDSSADSEKVDDLTRLFAKNCYCERMRASRRREPSSPGSCYSKFQNGPLRQKLETTRATFKALHKLDQDRAAFDRLRQLMLSQGKLCPTDGVDTQDAKQESIGYMFIGVKVCSHAWQQLLGIGSGRFRRLFKAARSGSLSPPTDMRFRGSPIYISSAAERPGGRFFYGSSPIRRPLRLLCRRRCRRRGCANRTKKPKGNLAPGPGAELNICRSGPWIEVHHRKPPWS